MSLTLKHFDTRLNNWIYTDGNTSNFDSILTEELENTLLEYFFPDKEFSFGQMDEKSTPEDLKNHPNNHVLLFSSKTRLLYGPEECLEVVEKLCPDRKDRGAYGSIFLGSCKNAINEKLNILVVDDATGENGGILTNKNAWKLVGDCYGQIFIELYDRLTRQVDKEEKNYRVIQHRFGWQETEGEDTKYRFGKGTLRPYIIENLEYVEPENNPKIDIIIPLSSFKGTDKDNPNSPVKPQIKPGLYNQTIWLGEKSQSQRGRTAISQLIASFPQGLKDFFEELEKQAVELARIQDDPRKVAQKYCEKYEKRKLLTAGYKSLLEQEITVQAQEDRLTEQLELATPDFDLDDDLEDKNKTEKDDLFMYKLIKADLMGHCQLLEVEKVKQELSRFVQNEWQDIAIGRTLTFDRGMIIPSKALKNGEICVPWFDDGEKVLNFRSPFLNSNGLCVSINKQVEDYFGPNGKPLEGIIVVNDEDHKRIQARIEALKAQGEVLEVDPAETESERQGRDFDGDCIGVELASKYPNLTAEAEYRNLPENAYAPTVKLKKQSFYREDGAQPEFEEIAIFMSDGISVGVINNQVTTLEALESEIEILKTYGTLQEKSDYLDKIANHYQKLFAQENNEKNPQPIREEYRERMNEVISLASDKNRTPALVEQAMEINRSVYRSMIEEGCFQNQVAVDMFKSARAPDMKLIKENKRYLYRDVNYIKDKKLPQAYLTEAIVPKGYSPVELLINQTNKYFQESQLESRPIVQFADLFQGVDFTPQQKFQAILAKEEFDNKFNEATRMERRRSSEQGAYAVIATPSGNNIEVTNLIRYEHPKIWKAQTLNIKFQEISEKYRSQDRPHTLLALAQIDGEMENGEPKYRKLGTVSQQSAIDYKLKPGTTIQGAALVEIKPELRKSQTKLLFQQAYAVAENFCASIPESERLSTAAATWSISATRQDDVEQNISTCYEDKKVSNFVFAAFPEEILGRLDKLQFTNIKLTGLGKEGDNFKERIWNPEEKYNIEIRASHYSKEHERHGYKVVFVKDNNEDYKEFAVLEQRTGRLPIGTQAQASIKSGEAYTAKATLLEPNKPAIEFTIRELSKFSHAGKTFNGEQVTLLIGNAPVPSQAAKIKLEGKILGELDVDSVKQLQEANYFENGNHLKLKLKTIETTKHESAFVIGESPNGNLIRINKLNYYDYQGQKFDAKYQNLTIEIPPTKNRDAVLLDGELLGVLHFKQDKEALRELGILKPGCQVPVQCNLQSNFTHTFVQVEESTVQYPKVWTKESQAFKGTTQQLVVTAQEAMIEKSAPFLQKLKERPTILFSSQEDKVLGLMGMAVDNHKVEIVQQWLKSRSIEFSAVVPEDVPLETKKGLAVLYLVTSTIKPRDDELLHAKFGELLDANGANNAYHNYLNYLPNRPQNTREDPEKITNSEQQTQVATVTSNSTHAQVKTELITTGATLNNPIQISTPVNIGSRSSDPLGAALTNPTVKAKELGNIKGDYPVSFQDNPFVAAGRCAAEVWTQDKPDGVPFVSAEQAYQHYKDTVPIGEARVQLMAEIIEAKLTQHPKLFEAIAARGGVEWLESCTHYVTSNKDNYWEGKGKDSPFIGALIDAYSKVLETSKTLTVTVSPISQHFNPLSNIEPLNNAVAPHMQKDIAMAQEANQFIGKSAAPPDTPSSTRNYEQAWGKGANTGVYSASDTIMVSGSGPWRGVTQQQILETFKNHYVPLLDKAIASGSSFVVGNAAGTDKLVQKYLTEHGYKLSSSKSDGYTRASPPEQVTFVDSSHEQTTIDSLRNWYSTADKLGKSEDYKNRIIEVATEFQSGQGLSEKALIAMTKDMEELCSINRLTQIAQRIGDVLGQPGEGGFILVNGKTYDISLNPLQKDLTISHKNGDLILDIESSKIKTNQISSEVIKTFEDINTKIDTALLQVKSEYVEM